MSEAPQDVRDLAVERAERRAARDFSGADELRDRITAMGWTVVDEAEGWRLEPVAQQPPAAGGAERVPAADVASVLDQPATADFSIHWVVEGWPEDVIRAIASFRSNAGAREVQYVVADVTGLDPSAFADGVEVVSLEEGTGCAGYL
jgi:hypothetical protein